MRIAEEDEIENIQPPVKRRRSCLNDDELHKSVNKLSEEVKEIKEAVKNFHNLAFRHKFSVSFLLELEGSFSCCICKRIPARKPLIACTECHSLIGCQVCSDQWYGGAQGLQRKCPKCRCDRGLAKTTVLKGFDKLLDHIKNLKEHSSSYESEDDDGSHQHDDTLPIVL